jgi:dihydroxyacetone kinase-like protein
MASLALQDVVELFGKLAAAFEENRDRLNELDATIGDGDHGMSMARGFSAVAAALRQKAPATISDALMQGGMQFNEVSGSTIGILMFSAMREAGKVAAGKQTLGAAELADMLAAAIDGIKRRGKAELGQKTILDSLHPGLEALRASLISGSPEEEALEAAARAAEAGADSTRELDSTIGRARWFSERSRGALDPGAVSGAIIVRTVADYLRHGGPK